jgi:transcription elongation factor GreA
VHIPIETGLTREGLGDLSENSEYQSAKEELAFTDGRISELEELVQNAKVTTPKSQDSIDVGHTVTVKVGNNEVAFQIVGEWEANPSLKKISHSSPLGKSLLGKRIGEKVEVDAPAGKILYTIMGIK